MSPENNQNNKSIAIWLFVCCFMVFGMVVVGGVTRLTESGLSMTDWKPVSRILPPMNMAEWQAEFDNYRRTPEYREKNYGMSLEEFKDIFRLEYIHRLLGRLTGIVFFLPFIWFLFRRKLDRPLKIKLTGIFILGAMQGVMGWYMVKSGLVDRPDVSHYRLVAHLLLAVVIYSAMFLLALGLWQGSADKHPKKGRFTAYIITLMIILQIAAGGFVAGLDAGLSYNTFPLMDGDFIPAGLFAHSPWYMNFLENTIMVQFFHRILAYIITISVIIFWLAMRRSHIKTAVNMLLGAVLVQFILGVMTLIYVVPVPLASLHQAFALVLLTVSLYIGKKLSS